MDEIAELKALSGSYENGACYVYKGKIFQFLQGDFKFVSDAKFKALVYDRPQQISQIRTLS